MKNEQATLVAVTAYFVCDHDACGLHMNDQGELAGPSLDLTLRTGRQARILEGVKAEFVTWWLFSKLPPGAYLPTLLNLGALDGCSLTIVLVNAKRLLDIL